MKVRPNRGDRNLLPLVIEQGRAVVQQCHKGRNSGSGWDQRDMSELHTRKTGAPGGRMWSCHTSLRVPQGVVGPFHLIVGLRMLPRRETCFHPEARQTWEMKCRILSDTISFQIPWMWKTCWTGRSPVSAAMGSLGSGTKWAAFKSDPPSSVSLCGCQREGDQWWNSQQCVTKDKVGLVPMMSPWLQHSQEQQAQGLNRSIWTPTVSKRRLSPLLPLNSPAGFQAVDRVVWAKAPSWRVRDVLLLGPFYSDCSVKIDWSSEKRTGNSSADRKKKSVSFAPQNPPQTNQKRSTRG